MKHFGDDEKKLRGKKITLDVISVRNPQSAMWCRRSGLARQ